MDEGQGKAKPQASPPPSPDVKRLIEVYIEAFRNRFRKEPVVPWDKYGGIARKLLAGRAYDEARRMVVEFFDNPPQFYEDRNLFGLEHVLRAAPTLLVRLSKRDGATP